MEFSHLFKIAYTTGSHRLLDSTRRLSGPVGLRWDPRIGISSKLPGDGNGDAAGAGTTTTGLRHPKTTCLLSWELCCKRTPSRRENTELVHREEKKKWQQNNSFLLQEGSC